MRAAAVPRSHVAWGVGRRAGFARSLRPHPYGAGRGRSPRPFRRLKVLDALGRFVDHGL